MHIIAIFFFYILWDLKVPACVFHYALNEMKMFLRARNDFKQFNACTDYACVFMAHYSEMREREWNVY